MSDLLTLKRIREDLNSYKINKEVALKTLEVIINESENEEIRAEAIELIGEIALKTEIIFKLLEKSLVSDESPLVRFSAAKVIIKNFIKHEHSPLLWAIENENSIFFFKQILDLLTKLTEENKEIKEIRRRSRERVMGLYKLNLEDAKFILDIDFIEYQRFRKEFKNFLEKFTVKEAHIKDLVKENTEIGYKGLGRIQSSKQGYITALNLADLDAIPESLSSLSRLESLSINRCRLKEIPDLSSRIQNLKHLNLSDNELEELPKWVFDFSRMKKNHQKYLNQGVIPSEAPILALLNMLTNNEILKSCDFLKTIQKYGYYFCIDKNGYIRGLYMKHPKKPKMGIIPKQICELNNIEELYFINQNIKKIPVCINRLKKLKILDLRENELNLIPKSIKKLEILRL
ncbi:MAG: hypothetical protein ACFFA8_09015 [Promethearchaeota archaeon]